MTDSIRKSSELSRRTLVATAGAASLAASLPRVAAAQQPHPNPMPEEIRKVLERNPGLPVLGNPNGNITLSEFFDYNCTFCRRNMKDVQRLITGDDQLRVVFREWPVFGDGSMFAAQASLASLKQGKYWQFHSDMMEMRGRAEEATVLRSARNVGLDIEKLRADMEAPKIIEQIYETMDLADTMSLSGTPTFIAGHEAAFGLMSLEDLRSLVAKAREDLL